MTTDLFQHALTLAFLAWLALGVSKRVDRVLTVVEERAKQPQPKPADPMPHDILVWANQWGSPWARDEALKSAEELHGRLGEWSGVRLALGINMGDEA